MGRMAKETGKDTVPPSVRIDEYIEKFADWRGDLLKRIRSAIHEADPDVIEEWKWMGTPVWSHEGIMCLANAHREKVKLTFQNGKELPDPHKIFNSMLDGNKWRAIDLFRDDDLDEGALKEIVKAAVAYNVSRRNK